MHAYQGNTFDSGNLMDQFLTRDTSPSLPNAPNREDLIIGGLGRGGRTVEPKSITQRSAGKHLGPTLGK